MSECAVLSARRSEALALIQANLRTSKIPIMHRYDQSYAFSSPITGFARIWTHPDGPMGLKVLTGSERVDASHRSYLAL